MKVLFYTISFLSFAPIGLYGLVQEHMKNEYYKFVLVILFILKSFMDLLLWYILIFELDSYFTKFAFGLLFVYLIIYYVKNISKTDIKQNRILKKISAFQLKKTNSNGKRNEKHNKDSSLSSSRNESTYNEDLSNSTENDFILTNHIYDDASSSSDYFSHRDNWKDSTERKKIKNIHRQQYPIITEINEYINTGEIFKFLYKKRDEDESTLRQVIPGEVFVSKGKVYLECLDIDDSNTRKTFRIDKMESIIGIIKNLSQDEIDNIKTKYRSLSQSQRLIVKTNRIIEKLTNGINVIIEISDEVDIKKIMENNGFIIKKGKTCNFYDEKFNYIGTKFFNINQLIKILPNMYSISPFGIFEYDENTRSIRRTRNYDLYTYSEKMVNLLNDYNPEVYYDLKAKVNLLKKLEKIN